MDKVTTLTPVFVESIPELLEQGNLYISEKHGVSVHLCACGCGHKTVLDFRPEWPDGWDMKNNKGKITFRPSIGNFNFPCKSHYYITENRVEWL